MTSKRKYEDTGSAEGALTTEEIMTIVGTMVSYQGTSQQKQLRFADHFPEFKAQYPFLFDMACAPDFDMERFTYMMNLREQVSKQSRTLEDASKEIGQKLFNEYVKPHVGKK